MTFKDAGQALRASIIVDPLTDDQIVDCRSLLTRHDAMDLVEMVGVAS